MANWEGLVLDLDLEETEVGFCLRCSGFAFVEMKGQALIMQERTSLLCFSINVSVTQKIDEWESLCAG